MAQNSLLINEPINLCVSALKSYNHKFDDPLTYTIKFWGEILACLDNQARNENTNYDHFETLLSHLIQDYSIWHPAIDSFVDSFYISKQGVKARKSDLNLYQVLAWYVFYKNVPDSIHVDHKKEVVSNAAKGMRAKNLSKSTKEPFSNFVSFLGGHDKSRKNGILQKTQLFLEFLLLSPEEKIFQFYAALSEHYDSIFIEENILSRYDYNFINNLMTSLEIPTKTPSIKKLTVPKSPNLILKTPIERLADFDLKEILQMRKNEENMMRQDKRIIYANQVPPSTYVQETFKKPAKPRATSAHSFDLTKKKGWKTKYVRGEPLKSDDNHITNEQKFRAREVPENLFNPTKSDPIKDNTTTILRKIATLKNKQADVYYNLISQQFGNDWEYQKHVKKVKLEEAIEKYEKSLAQKLSSELSFENAILASEELIKTKTEQHLQLKKLLEQDLFAANQKAGKDLEQLAISNKIFEQTLKENVKFSKDQLLNQNIVNVKNQTDQLKKMVKKALELQRRQFLEKQQLVNKIKSQEEELRTKFNNGDFNKVIDELSTSNIGLLNEMSLKEMRLRYQFLQKKNAMLNEKLNQKIKKDKIDKKARIDSTYKKLLAIDEAEKKRADAEKLKSTLERRVSIDSFKSETINLLENQLMQARERRRTRNSKSSLQQ